jgi:hypothetical protein
MTTLRIDIKEKEVLLWLLAFFTLTAWTKVELSESSLNLNIVIKLARLRQYERFIKKQTVKANWWSWPYSHIMYGGFHPYSYGTESIQRRKCQVVSAFTDLSQRRLFAFSAICVRPQVCVRDWLTELMQSAMMYANSSSIARFLTFHNEILLTLESV